MARTVVWLNLITGKPGGYGVVSQEEKGTSLVKIHTYPATVYRNVVVQRSVVCLQFHGFLWRGSEGLLSARGGDILGGCVVFSVVS